MKHKHSKQTIVGRKPVLEALKAGTSIESIMVMEGVHGKEIEAIYELAARRQVPVKEGDKQMFRQPAGDSTTQGIVAIVPEHSYAALDDILEIARARKQKGFILLLDEIEDPHNLGALIRTADCAGVHGVIIPKHHSASVNATVTKASAGATQHMAIVEVANLVNTIEKLKELEYWVVGLDGAGDKTYSEIDYTTPIALVVGNEGKGIRRLVKEHCDFLVRVPLLGRIESLNASVAGGLVMFEVARQRMKN